MVLPFLTFDPLPPVPREFRAAWVATVDNIDWPSKRGLSATQQRAELIRILDRAVTLKLNAIVLQVRPAADALYRSKLEPWSEYLTGSQGKDPGYDPLSFAIEAAHQRGLELHAWFNPYRAKHPSAKSALASNHLARTNPGVVKTYGKYLWMDPGEPAVQARSKAVFLDVVKRYDVDGIHIDDYFYPYKEKDLDFPDSGSFARYGKGLGLSDWRRKNVDDFVRDVYREMHQIKPWVQFGISPFGVYRPGYPAGITAGVDQYADLYADPLKWLQEGWLDYLAPQLYWPIAQKAQSFPVLLKYWRSENTKGRHIWPGLYTSRTLPGVSNPGYLAEEVVRQVLETRKEGNDAGQIHFSMDSLSKNGRGVADALRGKCYAQDALPPASPWLDSTPPPTPSLTVTTENGMRVLKWDTPSEVNEAFRRVVWLRYGNRWQTRVLPGPKEGLSIPETLAIGTLNQVAVANVDRAGNVSEPAPWSSEQP